MSRTAFIRGRMGPKTITFILLIGALATAAIHFTRTASELPPAQKTVERPSASDVGDRAVAPQDETPFDFYDKQNQSKSSGTYLLAYFFRSGDKDKWNHFLESVTRRWRGQIDIAYVPMDDAQARPLLTTYRLRVSPSLLVFAPNGAVTAGFIYEPPDIGMISKSLVSSSMADVILSIQKRQFTFLVIGDEGEETYEENSQVAATAAQTLEGMATAISVDAENNDAADLLLNLGLSPNEQATHTYVVSPAGGVVTHLQGRITEETLYDSFSKVLAQQKGCGDRTVTGGSSCEPGKGVVGGGGCGTRRRVNR